MPIRSRAVSGYITVREADKTLASLASESALVCYAVCKGIPWHAQWAGRIRNPHSGRSVFTAGQPANMEFTMKLEQSSRRRMKKSLDYASEILKAP
jgi:hypothetical protein